MGRTVPTYRMTLETVALRFSGYRRALREGDRRAFDRLLDRARAHSSAASYDAALDPREVALLSVLLDQELTLMKLQRAVDELSWAVLGRAGGSSGTLDAAGVVPNAFGGSPARQSTPQTEPDVHEGGPLASRAPMPSDAV